MSAKKTDKVTNETLYKYEISGPYEMELPTVNLGRGHGQHSSKTKNHNSKANPK